MALLTESMKSYLNGKKEVSKNYEKVLNCRINQRIKDIANDILLIKQSNKSNQFNEAIHYLHNMLKELDDKNNDNHENDASIDVDELKIMEQLDKEISELFLK